MAVTKDTRLSHDINPLIEIEYYVTLEGRWLWQIMYSTLITVNIPLL